MNSIIMTDDGVIVFVNSKPYMIGKEHPHYGDIIELSRNGKWDEIPEIANIQYAVTAAIEKTGNEHLRIVNNQVIYKHVAFPDDLSDYIINIIRYSGDLTPYVNFMDKLLENPDHRVFQQLFGFMSYGKNPITPEGNILAYKKVRSDYTSVHDGITVNKVGTTVELPREKCNSNPEETCSSGLHFCSKEYLNNFGGARVMVVEVSPTDVVSIPVDYNNTKARACRYIIVGELVDSEIVNVDASFGPATVVDTYVTSTVVEADVSHSATNDEIDEYLQGYSDGRKKLTKNLKYSVSGFYNDGYRAGRSKKKRKYSELDKV